MAERSTGSSAASSGNEPMVVLTIEMTPEDYLASKKQANWTHGTQVERFMVDAALGRLPRGC